jgi:hypothetical protein
MGDDLNRSLDRIIRTETTHRFRTLGAPPVGGIPGSAVVVPHTWAVRSFG